MGRPKDQQPLGEGFNVRVYGILIENGKVLVSEEDHNGTFLRKFPGGGIEKGESPREALIREFQEEASYQVQLGDFFYASPEFHRSYFRPLQLISLYWRVQAEAGEGVFVQHESPQPLNSPGHSYQLIWKELKNLKVEDFTADIDREVVEKLLSGN